MQEERANSFKQKCAIDEVPGSSANYMFTVNLRSFTSTGIAILSSTAIASSSALVYAEDEKNRSFRRQEIKN
jgi:hypothetical protein